MFFCKFNNHNPKEKGFPISFVTKCKLLRTINKIYFSIKQKFQYSVCSSKQIRVYFSLLKEFQKTNLSNRQVLRDLLQYFYDIQSLTSSIVSLQEPLIISESVCFHPNRQQILLAHYKQNIIITQGNCEFSGKLFETAELCFRKLSLKMFLPGQIFCASNMRQSSLNFYYFRVVCHLRKLKQRKKCFYFHNMGRSQFQSRYREVNVNVLCTKGLSSLESIHSKCCAL